MFTQAPKGPQATRGKDMNELSDINDLLSTRLMQNVCINNVQNGTIWVRRGVFSVMSVSQDEKGIKVSQKSLKGGYIFIGGKMIKSELNLSKAKNA